eukprot:CAMPEP_0184318684 /NCGR_PEP_ID=MMETSP1049-20130417/104043_1 /TAXON_ID=77928 /ORGANISM="Proteomonas sulcata, Strain CCMP704" /LENGTH=230 /DNA_ID=CAMNT_0026638537 /DNA_START=1 /DNA_END=693 /DNA_ORIENTATION=-
MAYFLCFRWLGIGAKKQPMDLWNYQEIIFNLRPKLLVEFGTSNGGSTRFLADLMKTIHGTERLDYRVLSVDVEHSKVHESLWEMPHVELLQAPSQSRRTQNRIRELREKYPGPMWLILDGLHDRISVLLELQMSVPLLVEGDYLIVEDSNLDGYPEAVQQGWGPCAYDAIVEFAAMNRHILKRDIEREFKFGFTQSVVGFWNIKGRPMGSTDALEVFNLLSDEENPWLNA